MKLQARAARYLGGLGVIFMFSLIYIFQSILNTRLCKILLFVQFLFFQAPCKNFGFFQNINDFFYEKFGLGRLNLQLPRSLNLLGAVTCGAQELSRKKKVWIFPKYKRFFNEKFGLGRRKLRLPRSLNLLSAVTCGAQ